ncbi:MAG: transcriptional repressor [Bacteroidales bacterium]|nr:transcriptional repressor [Bacteroidales bacterium]
MKTPNHIEEIQNKLKASGLKITPQRIAVLEAIYTLQNHPVAEQIIGFVHRKNPNVATGTVYKILDTFVEKGVITKFRTQEEAAHYDGILSSHHHLYSSETDRIADFENEELDQLLIDFFTKNGISGFEIESIKLQINGKFHNR